MAKSNLTFLLLILMTDVHSCPFAPEEVYVKAGEMLVLQCPRCTGPRLSDETRVRWTGPNTQEVRVISDMASAEQRQMLIHGRSLVILIASVNHQGNYSCSLGNTSKPFWFRLTVPETGNEMRNKHHMVCSMHETCSLTCPRVNNSDVNSLNISIFNNVMWMKEGESLPNGGNLLNVDINHQGDYTCTRLYLYNGQIYKMTSTLNLQVQPEGSPGKSMILSPPNTNVVYVDLGSRVTVDCKAVVFSDFDELFWLSDSSFVELNESFPVFYTYHTSGQKVDGMKVTATLVFTKVCEEDLSRQYRCKLDSVSVPSSFVTITLAREAQPVALILALSAVGILVAIAAVIVFVKFKVHIVLFLRDTVRCGPSSADGKSYDAFLMYYDSKADAGLNKEDVQRMEGVLEEKFGYRLCLYDRDLVQGRAEADAVLDCIQQSGTLVFVPTSPGGGLGSAVLKDVCEALLRRQNHLVFIKTKMSGWPTSGSLPRSSELLSRAAGVVTWEGVVSQSRSSSFFKQLRYHLSAPRHPPQDRLLP